MIYADVILDISLEKLDKTFQYAVPDHLSESIKEGSVVIVPFGNGQRFLKGYVMSLSGEPKIDRAKIKPIRSLAEDELGPEEQMIALAAWMKKNYGGTMNQALKTVIPVHKKYTPREEKYVCPAVPKDILQGELNALLSRKKHSVAKERLMRELLSEEEIPWDVITGKLSVPSSNIRDLEKKGKLILPTACEYSTPSWFGFLMTCNEGVSRNKLVRDLENAGIQTRMLFSGNLIKHPCFDEMRASGEGYRVIGNLTNTDRIMDDTFWIGVYPGLTDDMLDYMIDKIHEFIEA